MRARVSETSQAWKWPRACACCLVGTSSRLADGAHSVEARSARDAVVDAPYCPACAEHVAQHLSAGRFRRRGLIWSALVAVGVAMAAHPAVAVVCFLIMAAKISAMSCDQLQEAHVGMSRECACPGPAVRRVASGHDAKEIVFANECFEDLFDRHNRSGPIGPDLRNGGDNIIPFPGKALTPFLRPGAGGV